MLLAGATLASGAALVYAVSLLGLTGIRDAAARIGWGFLVILILSAIREGARALAWTRAVEGTVALPIGEAFRARLAGESLNTLLPMGFVVGEPAKAEYVTPRLPFSVAFSALLVELALYSASLLLVFAAGAAAALPPRALVIAALVAVPAVLLLKRARRLYEPLLAFARRHPTRVWHIAALEITYHGLGVVEAYVTLTLLGVTAGAWTSALVLETVNRCVTLVFKMVPLRMGLDEASAAMTAQALALGTGAGLVLALVRKLRMLFWSAIGLALLAIRSAQRSRVSLPSAALARS